MEKPSKAGRVKRGSRKDPKLVEGWACLEAQLAPINGPLRDLDELDSLELLREPDNRTRSRNGTHGQSISIIKKLRSQRARPMLEKSIIQDFEYFYQTSHNEVLNPLFMDWIDSAIEPDHWITYRLLPPMIRFALRRPLMPEMEFQRQLYYCGVKDSLDRLSADEKTWFRRERGLLKGIEPASPTRRSLLDQYRSVLYPEQHSCYVNDALNRECNGPNKKHKNDSEPQHVELSTEEDVLVKEIAEVIDNYRSKNISLDEAHHAIQLVMEGLSIETDLLYELIQDPNPRSFIVAIAIIEESTLDSPEFSPADDASESHQPSAQCVERSSPAIRLSSDNSSQLKAIYKDVVNGRTPVHAAVPKFCSVLGDPEMPDGVLSGFLTLHNIPADLFFPDTLTDEIRSAVNSALADLEKLGSDLIPASNSFLRSSNNSFKALEFRPEMVGTRTLTSCIDPTELASPQSSYKSKRRAQDTEPQMYELHIPSDVDSRDSQPQKRASGLYSSKPNPETPGPGKSPRQPLGELQVSDVTGLITYQGNAGTVTQDLSEQTLADRDNEEEELPNTFQYMNDVTCQSRPGIEKVVHMSTNTELDPDKLTCIRKPAETVSSVHKCIIAEQLMPSSTEDHHTDPHTVPSTEYYPEILVLDDSDLESEDSDNLTDSLVTSPSGSKGSKSTLEHWLASVPGSVGNPCGKDTSDSHQSDSSENGETKEFWGLAMPTRTAREIAVKIGLPRDYVESRIRSATPHRQSSRKAKEVERNTPSQLPKRKLSLSPAGGPSRKSSKVNKELEHYALGEDHYENCKMHCQNNLPSRYVCQTKQYPMTPTTGHPRSNSVDEEGSVPSPCPSLEQSVFPVSSQSKTADNKYCTEEDSNLWQMPPAYRSTASSSGSESPEAVQTPTHSEYGQGDQQIITYEKSVPNSSTSIHSTSISREMWPSSMEGVVKSTTPSIDDSTYFRPDLSSMDRVVRFTPQFAGRLPPAKIAKMIGIFLSGKTNTELVVENKNDIAQNPDVSSTSSSCSSNYYRSSNYDFSPYISSFKINDPEAIAKDEDVGKNNCTQSIDGQQDTGIHSKVMTPTHDCGHNPHRLSISSSFRDLKSAESERIHIDPVPPSTQNAAPIQSSQTQDVDFPSPSRDNSILREGATIPCSQTSSPLSQKVAIAAEALLLLSGTGQKGLETVAMTQSAPTSHAPVHNVSVRETSRPRVTKDMVLAKFDSFLEKANAAPIRPSVERDVWEEARQKNMRLDDYLKRIRWKRKYMANNSRKSRYFQSSNAPSGKSSVEKNLNKQFDNYRRMCCSF